MKFIKLFATAAIIVQAATGTGVAQQEETNNRVAAEQAWSVFENGDPKQCWAVATPRESLNADDQGRPKSVRRGKILLFVTHRVGGTQGEVSFTGGYPFAPGSTVTLEIGGDKFEMFIEGEYAWSSSPEDDAKIIAAMKKGTDAVLKAHSSRGTYTTDTFSLLGVTAATDEAAKRCQ